MVGLGVAVVTVGPQVWAAATAEIAEDDTTIFLETTGASATIPVDGGWVVSRALFDDSRVALRSPDGAMTVHFRLAVAPDPAAAARAQVPDELSAFDEETVGAVTVLHTRTPDGRSTVGALVEGEAVLAFESSALESYDAELAAVLSRIEVAP